jgi:hypothetical protein
VGGVGSAGSKLVLPLETRKYFSLNEEQCDESQPRCGQCAHRGVACDIIAKTSVLAPLSAAISESELLDHFTQTSGEWIGSPGTQRILQEHCYELIRGEPYLLHAILAFAASHIAFLVPSQKAYKAAATDHYERSLTLYSAQLRTSVGPQNCDSIIGCGHLQTMLAFRNICPGERTWDGGKFTWLRAMRAIPILWTTNNLHTHLGQSLWLDVCFESSLFPTVQPCGHAESDVDVENSRTGSMCRDLQLFCRSYGDQENCYQEQLSRLCILMQTNISRTHIGWFVGFVGTLSDMFLGKLQEDEPLALLIMVYWCTLFSQIDQWWIGDSVKVEARRLCGMLDGLQNRSLNRLLQFPASRCDYVLREVA